MSEEKGRYGSITKTLKQNIVPSAKSVLDAGRNAINTVASLPGRAIRSIRSGVKSAALGILMIAGTPVVATANTVGSAAKVATSAAAAVVKTPIQAVKVGVDVVEAVAITPVRKVVHWIESKPSTEVGISNIRDKTHARIDQATGKIAGLFKSEEGPTA